MSGASTTAVQGSLFDETPAILPDGLRYEADFLSPGEEGDLLRTVAALPLTPMRYREFTARREVLSFGGSYDFSAGQLEEAPEIPASLWPLRARVARWADIPEQALTHALVARYAVGTPLGWHRDVPDFEDILGVSLAGPALMRFRRWPPRESRRAEVRKLLIEPRSIYLVHGPARWEWQHSVAPVAGLRYSITFRTRRGLRGEPTAGPFSPPADAP
jgi:alkylated DNA repair dioxygenase AlkB